MTDEKKPFHEVISECIAVLQDELRFAYDKVVPASETRAYITVLRRSKMPAEEAHKLADILCKFRDLLYRVGLHELSRTVDSLIVDLRGREDEKKSDSEATTR